MDIAYQVVGGGPVDVLVMPGPFIPIDSIDAEPSMYRFHRSLASFSRVTRLDERGIGLSSRVHSMDVMGRRFWAEDAIAVMDAVDCQQATIFAPVYGAMAGLVLAAEYPERVRCLGIFNGAAWMRWAPDLSGRWRPRRVRGRSYVYGQDEAFRLPPDKNNFLWSLLSGLN